MVMRSVWIGAVWFGCCGFWVLSLPSVAQSQPMPSSVGQRVEQQMEAGQSAVESAVNAEAPVVSKEPAPEAPAQTSPAPTPQTLQAGPSTPAAEAPPAPESLAPVAESTPAPETVAAGEPVPQTPAAPSTYTVKRGDTLWTISKEFLSDPFFWPKVWNVNPAVTNPDLIYPGKVLTLPTEGAVETAEAQPAPPVAEAPAVTAPEANVAETGEEAPPAMVEAVLPPEPEQPMIAEEQPQAPAPFEAMPVPAQTREVLAISSGYIAMNVPMVGRVVGTYDYRVLLGQGDQVYLLPNRSALEAKGHYTVYRIVKQVVHPVSHRVVGKLVRVLGEVEVTAAGSPVATATVVKGYDVISPGDLLMPTRAIEAAPTTPVVERAGESLSGRVLDVMDERVVNGQFNVVYIDRGEASGVLAGDRFRIYRQGERTPGYMPIANVPLPDRLVGELEVLSVQAETATALLTRTTESILPGDRIER